MSSQSWDTKSQNPIFERYIAKLKRHPKRVVFSEGEDERVIRVASQLAQMELIAPILIGDRDKIAETAEKAGADLKFVGIKTPKTSAELELFCQYYSKAERFRGAKVINAEETLLKPQNFAAIMTQYGFADAFLGGNQDVPTSVYRAANLMIKPKNRDRSPFAASLLTADDHFKRFGQNNMLFFADTGIIPSPSIEELSYIATETGHMARHVLGRRPRIAMLSHSTKGSYPNEASKKIAAATRHTEQVINSKGLDMAVFGEIQADVALDPLASQIKLNTGEDHANADVLVFPSLDASNIAYRLLEFGAGAKTYGHFILGLTRPVAQVTRAVSEDTLFGTSVLLGIEAIKYRQLYNE